MQKYKYVHEYKTKFGIKYYYSYKGILKRGYKSALGAYLAVSRLTKSSFDELKKLTFKKLIKNYCEYKFSSCEFTTAERIKGEINNYMLGFIPADKLIIKLEKRDFEKFYKHLKECKLENKSRVLNRLLEIFDYLNKAYSYNCPYPYRLAKFNEKKINFTNLNEEKFYTPEEALKIINNMSSATKEELFKKLCVAFVIFGCCRISEMRGIKWNHYSNGYIFIEVQLYRGREKRLKSAKSYRKFKLLSIVAELLEKYKNLSKNIKDEQYIFIYEKTKKVVSPQTVRRWIIESSEAVGLKYCSPHKGRHTMATFIRAVGGDEYVMADILGHTPDIAKKVYAHCFQEEKNETINLMDNMIKNKIKNHL